MSRVVKHSLRLIQFSDPHLFGDAGGTLRGVATLPALQAAVAHAGRFHSERDAVLLTGDLVQDDPGGYAHLRDTFKDASTPVFCLPGNHDLPDVMRSTLRDAPFRLGEPFEAAGWMVVMLDTWQAGSAGGRMGSSQIEALDRLLAEQSACHVLLCLHHQPLPMESRWLDAVGLADAEDFLAVVRRHTNVRGVLWGHVHQALDRYVDGVRYMASPATCAQFMPRSDEFVLDRRPPGYRVLDLMPDGVIASEVVWIRE